MATKTLSENIQTAITDLSNIKTALVGKGVAIPSGTPTNKSRFFNDDEQTDIWTKAHLKTPV